ncbi:MAG: phospholipid/cholesterol/gamma-HCH transport system permease protein [Pseudomonadota bacterium]|nr:phospholipid/cholesterol/gamma-HCH transport system permease protein [Pseudomonadota bacterium]
MYKESASRKLINADKAQMTFDKARDVINLSGAWLWSSIDEELLFKQLNEINCIISSRSSGNRDGSNNVNHDGGISKISLDGTAIDCADTTGIYQIVKIVKYLQQHKIGLLKLELNEQEKLLFDRILPHINQIEDKPYAPAKRRSFFSNVGKSLFDGWFTILDLLNFFGQFCFNLVRFIISPKHLDWSEVVRVINDAGVKGLWVASLLSFLIGITLAYQMAPQFTTYGANVYIVNFLGIALLKEVSPLLTAVIVAGRTGAAITAEIGTQKVQEEIDALQTMGISRMQKIVLPKIIGVMIATPLITAVADMVSMLGGAIVANGSLSVNYELFLYRMQTYVALSNYACGIVKSFVFAFLISLAGCFCGLNVKGNANSIGEQTTKSVVMGIILIVLFDAIFAVIFKTMGV